MYQMNIGIFYNPSQVDKIIPENLARKIIAGGATAKVFSDVQEMNGIDRLIVLGGDGTILHAARRSAEIGIPLVGVNFGRLGFLTEFEKEEAEQAANLVLNPACPILHRSMLEIRFNGKITYVLNEASLLRGVSKDYENTALKLSVKIDGSDAGTFTADGLLVATPTGSTAYSLSAGGSIMTPECGTFQLTPVCAFSLRSRPIVYPDSLELQLILPKNCTAVVYGDGTYLGEASESDLIQIRKADRIASFLTRNKNEYFRRLTEKLN